METKQRIFKWNEAENRITFNLEKDRCMMVNATEMAKAFGKDVPDFTANEGTKNFINACLRRAQWERKMNEESDSKNRNSGFLNIKTAEDLYTSKQKAGTWMHEILALKFAAWLDPDFELWVYLTIRDILFEAYKEDEETLRKIAGIQDEIAEKENELKNLPIIEEIESLRKDEQREKRKLEQRKKMRISGLRTIFPEDEMNGHKK